MYRQILFILLSLSDLVLTWWLLTTYPTIVEESNPFANWLLDQYGWMGLVFLKMAVIGVVIIIYRLLRSWRPQTAQTVLSFGCAVLIAVVGYSVSLAGQAQGWHNHMTELEARQAKLQEKVSSIKHHIRLMDRLGKELLSKRLSLKQAVVELGQSEKGRDPQWIAKAQEVYRCNNADVGMAVALIQQVRAEIQCHITSSHQQTLRKLTNEFRTMYGTPVNEHIPDYCNTTYLDENRASDDQFSAGD